MTSVLMRDRKGQHVDTETWREEGHVETEAEIGVEQPQAKELLEAGKGEEGLLKASSPGPSDRGGENLGPYDHH